MRPWSLVPCFFISACALSQRSLPIADLATPHGELSLDTDGAMGPVDLAGPDLTVAGGDAGGADLGTCGAMLKINEVQTGGAGGATDEWVELFNPCATPVSLTGFKLKYRAATNSTAVDTSTVALLTGTLAAGAYYLVANTAYSGAPTPDIKPFQGASGLAATGGGVGLRDSNDTLIDSVGWGSASNPFVKTAAAVAPAVGKSIARKPNGTDSGNNSVDFVEGTPTPKAPNS